MTSIHTKSSCPGLKTPEPASLTLMNQGDSKHLLPHAGYVSQHVPCTFHPSVQTAHHIHTRFNYKQQLRSTSHCTSTDTGHNFEHPVS